MYTRLKDIWNRLAKIDEITAMYFYSHGYTKNQSLLEKVKIFGVMLK